MKYPRTQMGWALTALVLMFATRSFASTPSVPTACRTPAVEEPSFKIPKPLIPPAPLVPQDCERPFFYHGEFYSSDSPHAQDASTLRYFVKSVPESVGYLDEYQSNREKSKISAYTGTFGIVLAVFLARNIARWTNPKDPLPIASALRASGVAIAAGGFFYSFTLLQTNELLIPKAVDAYNATKTEDPIELKFNAGWSF